MNNTSSGITSKGSRPPTTKIASHPVSLTICEAMKPPIVLPTEIPALIRITSRRGLRSGAWSVASAMAIGMPPPSPRPVPNRIAASDTRPVLNA